MDSRHPPKFTDPTKIQLKKTLAQRFIPLADSLRDILTRFGLRPYKVRIVRVRWSGNIRGVGTALVEDAMDILPTPLVQDLSTLAEVVTPVGLEEDGLILVSEISGRFTDDQLRFLGKNGEAPDPNVEVFYEIEFPQITTPSGDSVKRRFYPASAPHYFAGRLQWQIRLQKSHEDRSRNGDPE